MSFRKTIPVLLLCLLFLTGCFDQQEKMQEDMLRKEIAGFLIKYKEAVNKTDEKALSEIISPKFQSFSLSKENYIKNLFTKPMLIDQLGFANIRVEDYVVYANISSSGTLIFKPTVKVPLYKEMPVLNGTFKNTAVFAFLYEKEGLKLISAEDGLTTKTFYQGDFLPDLTEPLTNLQSIRPGEQVTVSFEAGKGMYNDVVFIFVNEHMLSGFSSTGTEPTNTESFIVTVPSDFPVGQNFEINVQAYAGKMNPLNPQEAALQGISVKTISLPVR